MIDRRVAVVFLFDTCTYKCGYCYFAETGRVLDASQLAPYRDPDFIRRVAGFFNKPRGDWRWLLTLTGGEPLLMPNLDLFCELLAEHGNKVAFYTAMMIGRNQPSFRYLLERGARHTDYLMVSYHHEAEAFEDEFFDKLSLLKQAGHNVMLRFVGHPKRLDRLDHLSARCREIDVSFYPTTLFSPIHPASYTEDERQALFSHMASASQVIQLLGGLDTTKTLCYAANRIVSIDVRTGAITPCVSTSKVIGDLYGDRLELEDGPIRCPSSGVPCICDIHFQQDLVVGAEDSGRFAQHKRGWVAPLPHREIRSRIEAGANGFSTTVAAIGQTRTAGEPALDKEAVKRSFQAQEDYIRSGYGGLFHPEFRSRQAGAVR